MKTIREVWNDNKDKYSLKLICGESGLFRQVAYVFHATDIRSLSHLRGNELVALAEKSHDGPVELSSFVSELIRRGASGLILSLNEYLEPSAVDETTRKLAGDASFPIFTMPWDMRTSDLLHDISDTLFNEDSKDAVIEGILSDLLYGATDDVVLARRLEELGLIGQKKYNVINVAGIKSEKPLLEVLKKSPVSHWLLCENGIYSIVFECPDESVALQIVDSLFIKFSATRGSDCSANVPTIGMGEAGSELSHVKYSYLNAVNALKVAHSTGKNFCRFRDLGMYQILLSIPDKGLLERLEREYLGALEEYDRENNSEYLKTLEEYLNCGGSVNEVASKLFTHRNTINYRMKRLREYLPFDIDDPDTHFMLKMAFFVKNHLH